MSQNPGRRPPNIALPIGHRIESAREAVPVTAVQLVVFRRHQKSQRDLEGIVDLMPIELEVECRSNPRNSRYDAIAERSHVEIEIADRLDQVRLKTDLFE